MKPSKEQLTFLSDMFQTKKARKVGPKLIDEWREIF